jgi:hypothetical protein
LMKRRPENRTANEECKAVAKAASALIVVTNV